MTWASNPRKNDAIDEVCQSWVVYRPEFQTITCRVMGLGTPTEVLRETDLDGDTGFGPPIRPY